MVPLPEPDPRKAQERRAETAFERVRRLFEAAIELPPGDRSAFLDRACSSPSVRRDVEQLLRRDAESNRIGELLDRGIASELMPPPERTDS